MTIGIIGVGNIGQKVADFTKALGLNVLLNDPPLQRKSNDDLFRPLDEIFEADIISLHVPLYMAGLDKTFHLFNEQNLNRLNKNAILINTSRGAVIDNDALGDIIDKKNLNVVLDVWENEPGINVNLLKKVIIGTPHIAGYSWEGKLNGTKMIYNSLCDYLHAENNFKFGKDNTGETLKFLKFSTLEKSLNDLISKIYDIKTDDKLNRKMIHKSKNEQLLFFHEMRKNYYARKEFNNFKIAVGNETGELKEMLEKLRFKVVN